MAEYELRKAAQRNKGKEPQRNDATLPRNKVAPAPRLSASESGRTDYDVEEGPQLSPMYDKYRVPRRRVSAPASPPARPPRGATCPPQPVLWSEGCDTLHPFVRGGASPTSTGGR